MLYNESMNFINDSAKYGSKLGLENMQNLLESIGNPHKDLKIVHVAGTNGKGSTCAMLNSILTEAGYIVGLYNSPALVYFNEGIKLNSKAVTNEELAEVASTIKLGIDTMLGKGLDHPTQFEIVTAIAFEFYKLKKTDIVILEVGMGGRLDATNVIDTPLISVITPIALDHLNFLGDTIAKVAREKAGILKANCDVVVGKQEDEAMEVIKECAKQQNSRLTVVDYATLNIKSITKLGSIFDIKVDGNLYRDTKVRLIGEHQIDNGIVALNVIANLQRKGYKISEDSIRNGLAKVIWAGRLELLSDRPTILIDGAHNLHGAKALAKTIKAAFKYKRLIGVIGILEDKDIGGVFNEILPLCDEVIFTKPDNPRAKYPSELISYAKQYGVEYNVEEHIIKAYKLGKSMLAQDDLLLCCGSLYMIGKIRGQVSAIY